MNTEIQEAPALFEYSSSDLVHHLPTKGKNEQELSRFDIELQRRWDAAMEGGAFRYNIDHIVTKVLPGPKGYVAQLNPPRIFVRRKPQELRCLNEPFNPNTFNFTKIPLKEIIFDMKKQKSHNGCFQNGAHFEGSQQQIEKSESSRNGSVIQNGEQESDVENNTMIINVSPMGYGHCLLVPHRKALKPQVLTLAALNSAVETVLLSKHSGFIMGFNSLCAMASVNHLHFHTFYLDYPLYLAHCPAHHLHGKWYEIDIFPCPAFALQLHSSTIEEMAGLAYKLCRYFVDNEIAHNLFFYRGTALDESGCQSTLRLCIWARKRMIGVLPSDNVFNLACVEMGGFLPVRDEGEFNRLTEEEADNILSTGRLTEEEYENIRKFIMTMS